MIIEIPYGDPLDVARGGAPGLKPPPLQMKADNFTK